LVDNELRLDFVVVGVVLDEFLQLLLAVSTKVLTVRIVKSCTGGKAGGGVSPYLYDMLRLTWLDSVRPAIARDNTPNREFREIEGTKDTFDFEHVSSLGGRLR
jgi:hypothetical protein